MRCAHTIGTRFGRELEMALAVRLSAAHKSSDYSYQRLPAIPVYTAHFVITSDLVRLPVQHSSTTVAVFCQRSFRLRVKKGRQEKKSDPGDDEAAEWVSRVIKDPMVEVDPVTVLQQMMAEKSSPSKHSAFVLTTSLLEDSVPPPVNSSPPDNAVRAAGAALIAAALTAVAHAIRSHWFEADSILKAGIAEPGETLGACIPHPVAGFESKMADSSVVKSPERVCAAGDRESLNDALCMKGSETLGAVVGLSMSDVLTHTIMPEDCTFNDRTEGAVNVTRCEGALLPETKGSRGHHVSIFEVNGGPCRSLIRVPAGMHAYMTMGPGIDADSTGIENAAMQYSRPSTTSGTKLSSSRPEYFKKITAHHPQGFSVQSYFVTSSYGKSGNKSLVGDFKQTFSIFPPSLLLKPEVWKRDYILDEDSPAAKVLQGDSESGADGVQFLTESTCEGGLDLQSQPGPLDQATGRSHAVNVVCAAGAVDATVRSSSDPGKLCDPSLLLQDWIAGLSGSFLVEEEIGNPFRVDNLPASRKIVEDKEGSFRSAINAIFPAIAVGGGAGGVVAGVDGALEMVGMIATISFISYEVLWANRRRQLWKEMSQISDHEKLLEFLRARKIVQDC